MTGYDVIVIGGGPAGMMAAGTAAEMGASVALVEKNRQNGRKLLITGKGRCNVTNASDMEQYQRSIFTWTNSPGRILTVRRIRSCSLSFAPAMCLSLSRLIGWVATTPTSLTSGA